MKYTEKNLLNLNTYFFRIIRKHIYLQEINIYSIKNYSYNKLMIPISNKYMFTFSKCLLRITQANIY